MNYYYKWACLQWNPGTPPGGEAWTPSRRQSIGNQLAVGWQPKGLLLGKEKQGGFICGCNGRVIYVTSGVAGKEDVFERDLALE